MKSKSNKHKLEKRKKIEMSEGERNLAVRGRKATEREVVARDAAERERESHTCALRGRESWWCVERERALLRREKKSWWCAEKERASGVFRRKDEF